MIKTVPLDIPVNFMTGSLIVLAASRGIRAGADILSRPFKIAVLFSAWFGLTVTYFYFMQPDWMYAYLMPVDWPLLIFGYIAFMAALVAAGACGALSTAVWLQRSQRRAWIPAVYGLLNWALVMAFTYDRYFKLGTYQEYHGGTAGLLKEHAGMQKAMTWAGSLEIIPLVLIVLVIWFVNRKHKQAVPPPGELPGDPAAAVESA